MIVLDACTTSDGAAGVARPDAAASAIPAATGGHRVDTGTTPSQLRAFLGQHGQRGWRTGGEREEWFLEGDPTLEQFVDEGGMYWWWRESDGMCFYELAALYDPFHLLSLPGTVPGPQQRQMVLHGC